MFTIIKGNIEAFIKPVQRAQAEFFALQLGDNAQIYLNGTLFEVIKDGEFYLVNPLDGKTYD